MKEFIEVLEAAIALAPSEPPEVVKLRKAKTPVRKSISYGSLKRDPSSQKEFMFHRSRRFNVNDMLERLGFSKIELQCGPCKMRVWNTEEALTIILKNARKSC